MKPGKPKSRKEWEDYAWKRLVENFAKTSSPQAIENSLLMLTSAYERKQITKRAAALELLKQGKSYNEISRTLWLSPMAISALRKSITKGNYLSVHEWGKTRKGKKIWSSFFKTSRQGPDPKKYILPHGKLVYPQRRKR